LIKDGKFICLADSLNIYQSETDDYLSFFSEATRYKSRKYQGDFQCFVRDGFLQITNRIVLDDYLEGVLASEAGVNLETEYYKVQAIISRTYAFNNWKKHAHEGFNLCDDVHCQAYFGRYSGESRTIIDGVYDTKGTVLLDTNQLRFPVFFSANCGGQSAETDQIWNSSIPAYVSRPDTFCIHTRQAQWEKYINKSDFLTFLEDEYFLDISNSNIYDRIINFRQEKRKTFFLNPAFGIPLRDIRREFGLKSTYFSTEKVGDKILFRGKGFGHGIGLCQEGAMQMIRKGFSHKEVMQYYFSGAKTYDFRETIIYK
jgi:stage II sporulation protein D